MIGNALQRFGGCDGPTESDAINAVLAVLPSEVLTRRKKIDSVIIAATANESSMISREPFLQVTTDSVHDMATQLRNGILAKEPAVVLSGEVECDEVYIVAGHKGNPEAVKKKEGRGVEGV